METVLVTLSLDFSSPRLVDERVTSGAMLAFAVLVSSHRFLHYPPSVFDRSRCCLSTLLVEIHRIDLHLDDDNVEVHFFTGRLPLDCDCLSVSSLL